MIKKTVIILLIILVIAGLSYGAYVLYHIIMLDVTERIRLAVADGIDDGMSRALNLLSLPGRIFGGNK